ncbi:MAG: alpha-ribazole phosphatase family protein [Gammaproteobacteria bacterium]|nr:alpha-ribazole phosphatase family protein [Gammaproteobacteria bacterium]
MSGIDDRSEGRAKRFVLVRHTRPAAAATLCYGRTDLALPDDWTTDVAACVARLPPTVRVYTSPSMRCRLLAREIGRRDRVEVQVDDRLQELDFGRWEGRRWDAIPSGEIDAWKENLLDYAPGGGESLRMLWSRVQRWFDDVLAPIGGRAIVVTHQGPIRALAAQLCGQPVERMFTRRVPWGGVIDAAAAAVPQDRPSRTRMPRDEAARDEAARASVITQNAAAFRGPSR